MESGLTFYLAGEISEDNDWRIPFVNGFTEARLRETECIPILRNAIDGKHHYCGPFINDECREGDALVRNLQAIHMADAVFAFFGPLPQYKAIAQVAYTKALGKPLVIHFKPHLPELRPIYDLADWASGGSLRGAFESFVEWYTPVQFDSPIEQAFWDEMRSRGPLIRLKPQHPVLDGKYRIDFADLPSKTAIELDGYEFHSSKDQFIKDRKRQREIEREGWRVIRFSGSEIHKDVAKCVDEALAMICQK